MLLTLRLKIIVVICFIATAVDINAAPDPCITGHYCIINSWSDWSNCNATCGVMGITRREKYVCCDTSRYKTLAQCLRGCNITMQWWQNSSVQTRTCGYCKNGTFNSNQNVCDCRHGYGGSCCEVNLSTQKPFIQTHKVMKTWAIVLIVLLVLAVVASCSVCCWCLLISGDRKRKKNEVRPYKEMEGRTVSSSCLRCLSQMKNLQFPRFKQRMQA